MVHCTEILLITLKFINLFEVIGVLTIRWCRYFFRTRCSSTCISFLVKTHVTVHAMSTKNS